jgi:Galactose oxidase, central domain
VQAFVHGDYMYVIGGGCFKPLCEDIDVHRLHLTTMTWSQVATQGSVPMARVAHTCAYDPSDGERHELASLPLWA